MDAMKNKYELADVIRKFGAALMQQEKLSPLQIKVLNNIVQCRTAALGGHEEVCDCCGTLHYSYNSCGDRHCPKCLSAKQIQWIEKLAETTLPVKHYHIIFTVPHCLNDICLWNDKAYYKILFKTVWDTLQSFGYTHFGVEPGAVAILHTWGQNLSLHPHIHCIVPAAGYSIRGKWIQIGKYEKFLYPVQQLSKTFRGKFLDSTKRLLKKHEKLRGFSEQIDIAYNKKWVVHCEPPLTNVDHVIQYLGRYTHRVAISNDKIINISDSHVTFWTKDYRDNGNAKPITLDGVEFLRRFCLHVLPKYFVKIRRFGVYNATTQRNLEIQCNISVKTPSKPKKKETAKELIKRVTGIDLTLCPHCKKGHLRTIKDIPRIRSPARHLPSSFLLNLL